ncbi:transcriptional initiation protein Tat [Acidithiobacillus ferrooxidans F221]|uniref:thiosulfate dehydrogenase n=1 Tax=Acidithiobacillus ferrooxidans TaxID=920 RepID=UPI001C066ED4|nr:transcriptional initiation protein Tat [Acidithiobacillus ferrooxidans]MBU2808693.1 transcriptional initiation protein Tat [Acidithiobacillus ferrooxidans F221]
MSNERNLLSRRDAMKRALWGAGALAVGAVSAQTSAVAAGLSGNPGNLLPTGARSLKELGERLAKTPRRRDFKTVPMILTKPDEWDDAALREIIHYAGGPKQVWDNTDVSSPWLNLMRNSMNVQVWSFRHPDFLCVSATHGSAHWALYDDFIWNKYLAQMTGGKWKDNEWIKQPPAAAADPANFESPEGVFSPGDNSVTVLQRRGAVFLGCHNGIWEITEGVIKKGINPDGLSHEQMAAEFTNHLIPGVILTPGVVGTLPELQLAGFQYAK